MVVILDESMKGHNLMWISDHSKPHHALILGCECVSHIKDIGDTTTHPSCEIMACGTKGDYTTTCHILAPMITHAFDNCVCTRVMNCRPLCSDTSDEDLIRGGTI